MKPIDDRIVSVEDAEDGLPGKPICILVITAVVVIFCLVAIPSIHFFFRWMKHITAAISPSG